MQRPPPDLAPDRRDAGSRHTLVCTRCGDVVAIEGGEPPGESMARRLGFEVSARRLQLFGCCAACRRSGRGTLAQPGGQA